MAVRKKKYSKAKTPSKTSKKVAKKAAKKTAKKTNPNARNVPRLDQAEMRKLEDINAQVSLLDTKCKLQDQHCANITLKKENLESQIKLLDHQMQVAREKQSRYSKELKTKVDNLKKMGFELKSKYGVNDSSDFISYNSMTGEIVTRK